MNKLNIKSKDIAKLERENIQLRRELLEEKQYRSDVEAALVEIADMVAAQDDAIVELAELIEEGADA